MPTPTPKSQLTARTHPYAAVLFADLVGFTAAASEMTPEALVTTLDVMFGHFDDACHGLGIEKIKTMGDCYMCCTMADQVPASRCLPACLFLRPTVGCYPQATLHPKNPK